MRVRHLTLVLGLGLLAFGLVVWQGPTDSAVSAAQPPPRVVTIEIFDNRFEPRWVHVPVGATVIWINRGKRNHTVTSRGGLWQDSGVLAPGDSWSVTFDIPGSFPYLSRLHPRHMMSGQIAVGKNSR